MEIKDTVYLICADLMEWSCDENNDKIKIKVKTNQKLIIIFNNVPSTK